MRTFVSLPLTHAGEVPSELGPDTRYPEALVALFVEEFTREGQVVFDPFAGFGTTLRVAERMSRLGYGLELDEARCTYARSQLSQPARLLAGDARRLGEYLFPPVNLCLTSPPYMMRDEEANPVAAYGEAGGYETYLGGLRSIFAAIATLLAPDGRVVIELANLKRAGQVTTLAWDVCAAVSQVLRFEGEIVIGWEPTYGYGYDHSYCLVFGKSDGIAP